MSKEVICDFEGALINAVRDRFPDTKNLGCPLHFKQACKREMIKYRLPKSETKIAMEHGMLDTLTVMDRKGFPNRAWPGSRQRFASSTKSVKWCTPKTWRTFGNCIDWTRIELLTPAFWNVHSIRRDLVARTYSPLERFNREINTAFANPHPSLSRFVQTIKELARRHVDLRDDINRGPATAPTRQTIELPSAVSSDSKASGIKFEEEDGVTL